MVTLLLADDRVDPNITNQDGYTALMWAAKERHASVVMVLLADDRVDPNMANQNGYTALMRAAVKGHASVVTLLLADERVDPNMTRRKGFTALMLAARRGHAPVVTLLLANACRRPRGPRPHQSVWPHGNHLCLSQSPRLRGEAVACQRRCLD